MEFKYEQLNNGLEVIAEVNPAAVSLAAGFFVRTGSRDETLQLAGVSHFLEHMMFKGTARRSAFDVNCDFDRMGADYNAFTTEENTVYYAAVLSEFQMQVLDVLCDIMRPAIRREDFDVEKKIILDEIARYEDQPRYRVYEKLMSEYFNGHPLGNRVLGTTESVAALKRKDMQAYFDRRYSPGNVTVVGVGNLDFEAFTDKVAQQCAHWEPYEIARETPSAPGAQRHKVVVDSKLSREHLGLISPGPAGQDEARYAAQLLATIVGDTTGSRLFYSLVEPAIAEVASMSYAPFDGTGAFVTFLFTAPEKARQAVHIAAEVFKTFVEEGLTDKELLAAKNKIASGATLQGELPMGRLAAVGFDWVYRKEYVPLARQIETLFSVSKDDIVELARRYDLTATTVLALGPCESI